MDSLCLIMDFGGGQSLPVSRKVRGAQVYCEIVPAHADAQAIAAKSPACLILCGEGDETAVPDPGVLGLKLPMLALGSSACALLAAAGGDISRVAGRKRTDTVMFSGSPLFEGAQAQERLIECTGPWGLPEGFESIATDSDGTVIGYACPENNWYGIRFYPESNDPDGLLMLENFLHRIAGLEANWTIERFLEASIPEIREKAGEGRVAAALSGGADSFVCAALLQQALGPQLMCLHVDNGLLRGEEGECIRRFAAARGISCVTVDAHEAYLKALDGVLFPEEKRSVTEAVLRETVSAQLSLIAGVDALAIGTTYSDVVRQRGSAMSGEMRFQVLEPLRALFKEEVRALGSLLGVEEEFLNRQPFPGPGLALRCLGEVTEKKLRLLRAADRIFAEEILSAGLDKRLSQYFVVLGDAQTRDPRTGNGWGQNAILRAVTRTADGDMTAYRMPYDLLERVTRRITDEVRGINRVVYDLSGQTASDVEWA